MGCCQSTTIPTRPTKQDVTSKNRQSLPESEDRAPPPPSVLEEETVKEVLSETPISKPPTPKIPTNINPTQEPDVLLQQAVKKIEPMDLSKPTEEEIIIVPEISEASEMCSFSGSFSTTTTLNEKDEGEVTQRVVPRSQAKTPRKRSYSGELHGTRDRGLRDPARRSAPSPVKRNQMRSRPAQGRTTTVQRRNVGPTTGSRRDPGEASDQRSRSPAPRGEMVPGRNVGYKTPASSMTGNLGGRSPVRKVEDGEKLEKRDDGVSAAESNESLENPHVSLECFIFL